ncbi:uncharacterized protein LOC124393694 isoform X2 [Silurus meridionalis]|uniref:uncharacterized protein LOC124393694 isoform X2 n=1 Tax=Silurus meridionalis TaxID=175797 RepID=UPI001EEC1584|nr:uncharacterized protein LOC124393694 isoform X2 [Silurus meridionalis]
MDSVRWTRIVIRGIMCLAGIIGNNWLCISSLPKSVSQFRPNDVLFVNLAVSNLITNYLVDPLNIFQTERFLSVGKVFCSFRFFLPEFSETSSILSTMFITVYWHQKLVGSLKRGGAPVQMEKVHFIAALLAGSWTFAFVLNAPHLFFVADNPENTTAIDCKEALPSEEANQAYKNEKRMKKPGTPVKNEGNALPEKSADNTNSVPVVTKSKSQAKSSLVRAAKSVVAVAFFFLLCWIIHLIVSIIGSVTPSSVLDDIESFVGASYTCIIPYIYLHGVQRLTCSRGAGRVVDQEQGVSQTAAICLDVTEGIALVNLV